MGFPYGFPYPFGGDPGSSPLFTRILRWLLPKALAWRLPKGGPLSNLIEGLSGNPAVARTFFDEIFGDLLPDSTRELAEWERQFGITPASTTAARIAALKAEWQATGGQSPRYLQDIIRAAGFDVYIHEWWSSGPPYVARDPRSYTSQPLVGTMQCGEPLAECGEPSAQANIFLANEPGYIVNEALTQVAPPAIPADSTKWPHFLYWGSDVFPAKALVESARRRDFEERLLRFCPAEKWLVTRVVYTEQPPPPSYPWHTLLLPSTDVTIAGGVVTEVGNLGSNATPYVPGAAGTEPTIITGPHGYPELLFDGIDDFLASQTAVTLPTNYLVVMIARFTVAPSVNGHTAQMWVMVDDGTGWTERLAVNNSDLVDYVVAQQDNLGITPPTLLDVHTYAVAAPAYPAGQLRVDNVVTDASGPGTNSAPVTGKMTIANQPLGGSTQSAPIAVSMFGIVDLDLLGASVEEDLAALQAFAVAQLGAG